MFNDLADDRAMVKPSPSSLTYLFRITTAIKHLRRFTDRHAFAPISTPQLSNLGTQHFSALSWYQQQNTPSNTQDSLCFNRPRLVQLSEADEQHQQRRCTIQARLISPLLTSGTALDFARPSFE
ncbi:Uncharacterized protein HZ326_6212 [Fusarium oxysporum f. sp. albedinis]|nr:Uncharacterized protein HZ326_6212 [Fusarium oxysporum f. sp. albedinis]